MLMLIFRIDVLYANNLYLLKNVKSPINPASDTRTSKDKTLQSVVLIGHSCDLLYEIEFQIKVSKSSMTISTIFARALTCCAYQSAAELQFEHSS